MSGPRIGAARSGAKIVRLALLVLVLSALLAPVASASPDVAPGAAATIVNTGGDLINLRAKPRTSGSVLASYGEGTAVDVLEGPLWDDAGVAWFKVAVDGTRGYMAAEFLGSSGGGDGGESSGGALDPVTGSATIVNTGGDPIRCRSGAGSDYSITTTFAEGDAVELTGQATGSWQPVRCGGEGGFVHVDYVGSVEAGGDAVVDDGSDQVSAAASVRITNTGGDPINLRSKPRTSASVLDAFGEGTTVGILEGPITDAAGIAWYKVVVSGTRGYMAAEFLGLSATPTQTPTPDDGDGATSGSGTISGTNGDGVRCRSKASTSGSIITVLGEGSTVSLRGAATNGWQPVRCAGRSGYVSSEFVTVGGGGTDPDPEPGTGGEAGAFPAGTTLMVSATNGDGVRLRSRASSSASIVTVIAEGRNVEVRRGSTGAWIAVTYGSSDGFVHQDYLEIADEVTNPEPKSGLDVGDHALVTDTINFRSTASFNGVVIAVAKENTVVAVVGGRSNGFYKVEWAGQTGWMHADYLMWTDQAVSVGGGGVGGPGAPGDGPAADGGGTCEGRGMVRYAQRYLGYPYVWATHGPSTFDCSGFTYWVTLKTAGVDIGAGTWSQSVAGKPVAFGQLEPGDLVFFQNTYTWGLSHVGLYIGDGQFIHAQNEETGIVVSSLSSPYYKTRWFGARRVV